MRRIKRKNPKKGKMMYKPYFLEKRKIARTQCEDRRDTLKERSVGDGGEAENKEEAEQI